MNVERPKFIDSVFFVMEDENWHLLPGAPADVVEEFNEFNNRMRRMAEGEDDES